jgi:hypothetical protein
MKQRTLVILGLVVSLQIGCSSDGRLADFAEQVTHEQAAQNERMAEATQSIAQGSQQRVKADAQARNDLIDLQHSLRHDQAEVSRQRDALEAERVEIAQDRLTDSQVGSSLIAIAALLVALAPLVLAGISLLGLWREPTREEEGHILIEELSKDLIVNDNPTFPLLVEPDHFEDASSDERS